MHTTAAFVFSCAATDAPNIEIKERRTRARALTNMPRSSVYREWW